MFCNSCGSSYDAKLCPSRHMNPRSADVCSQCGSRDLSTPAPRVPFWLAPLLFGLSLLPAAVLALVLLAIALGIIQAVLTNQQVQAQLIVLFILLAVLWFIYIHIPKFIKDMFRSVWPGKKKDRRPH